jgi:DNA repair photolyase
VPQVSTNRMAGKLKTMGVNDPDSEWGDYVFVRRWDEPVFLRSLASAEITHPELLRVDGNRAVMFCTTTDPYQVLPDASLHERHAQNVRDALHAIRDFSTLNVRILTRSPLARTDFPLMKSFGPRLLFGMSLPTLNNRLAKVYEPKAPAPSQRLATLRAAKEAGLNVYVAVAPTYPECDEADLRATFAAIKELDPVTIFHEPINIRADNVARIARQAADAGVTLKSEVFASREAWREYAVGQLRQVEILADIFKLTDRLHLWPDESLGSQESLKQFGERQLGAFYSTEAWLNHHWSKVSAWPK